MDTLLKNRTKAFIVDYLTMGVIGILIFGIFNDLIISILIIYPLAMNKDFLNGKSLGKRIFNIQVQDLNNNIANEWKSSLRNLLFVIPFEVFFTLISPNRRIGDYLAGTKIEIDSKFKLSTINSELKNYRINRNLIFGLAFGIGNIYSLLWVIEMIFRMALN